jgi:hypothetical protein
VYTPATNLFSVFSKMDDYGGIRLRKWEFDSLRTGQVKGSVSEWFKVSVLKTDDCKRSVSSNLTASAI